jgi:hypothetical protein
VFEIMLNRRIVHTDRRGMGETLNEIDPVSEMPIRVPSVFYLSIHDEEVEESKQRLAQ